MRLTFLSLGAVGLGCLLVAWSGVAPFLISALPLLAGMGLIGGGVVAAMCSGLQKVWERERLRFLSALALVAGLGLGLGLVLMVLFDHRVLWQGGFALSRGSMEARVKELRARGMRAQREPGFIGVYSVSQIECGDEGWEFMVDSGPMDVKCNGYVWVTDRTRLREGTYYVHVTGDWFAFER